MRLRLEAWSLSDNRLTGRVYGHYRYEDGEAIKTSPVVKMKDNVAHTMSGTIYVLGHEYYNQDEENLKEEIA